MDEEKKDHLQRVDELIEKNKDKGGRQPFRQYLWWLRLPRRR